MSFRTEEWGVWGLLWSMAESNTEWTMEVKEMPCSFGAKIIEKYHRQTMGGVSNLLI